MTFFCSHSQTTNLKVKIILSVVQMTTTIYETKICGSDSDSGRGKVGNSVSDNVISDDRGSDGDSDSDSDIDRVSISDGDSGSHGDSDSVSVSE